MTEEKFDIALDILIEEINDFIDENPVMDTIPSSILESNINRIEEMRKATRLKSKEVHLLQGIDEYQKSYTIVMSSIKSYIKQAKAIIYSQQTRNQARSTVINEKSLEFDVSDISSKLDFIEQRLGTDITSASDDEIENFKRDAESTTKFLDKISSRIANLFSDCTIDALDEIEEVKTRYEKLIHLHQKLYLEIDHEFDKRELGKLKSFNKLTLSIKLAKFKGYSTAIDIYSFKNDFDKLYVRSAPKHLLADILKNNYLEGAALALVKHELLIDEIWKRLITNYGNVNLLLSNKLSELCGLDKVWKFKDSAKTLEALSKIINTMKDLMNLAEKHSIEPKLYYGDGITQIYKLIGDRCTTSWLKLCDDKLPDGKELWTKLLLFLEKELRIHQQKQVIHMSTVSDSNSNRGENKVGRSYHSSEYQNNQSDKTCYICGESDHISTIGPNNCKLIQYFVCQKFANMTPFERFQTLRSKNLCFQCLFPGADISTGRHREGRCQRDFVCPHYSHDDYAVKKHVLVCDEHKGNPENNELLQQFKARCMRSSTIPDFSRNIKINSTSQKTGYHVSTDTESSNDTGIYQLQQITVNNQSYLIFYDTGCSDFIIRNNAVKRLGKNAQLQFKGPIKLGGVGNVMTESTGVYSINLPTCEGRDALLTGPSLSKITNTFPRYPLDDVFKDIQSSYEKSGGNVSKLPSLPSSIGGDVDFMIGIKYLRYHPEPIFKLPSGLTIYRSIFKNSDGSRGVIGGPHHIFSAIDQYGHCKSTFFTNQLRTFEFGFQVNPDLKLLGYNHDAHVESYVKRETIFEMAEEAGSDVTYRCIKCRSCADCKNHDITESSSIREEVEQQVINKSVVVDIANNVTFATLPFTHDPKLRLQPNRWKAMKVYEQQTKRLSKHPHDKDDVIKSERKLQDLGHVEFVRNLPQATQEMLKSSEAQNFIAWRAVWKTNSLSTPCRIVFDASQATSSGYSLNSILAKGANGMNKLVDIFIRWFTHRAAFHTDVCKMYNSIKLQQSDWCYQRYLWDDSLTVGGKPEEKVIKTLIYGVKSSGNQAERGLRQTAHLSIHDYPEVNLIINKDVYVDDCITGEKSMSEAMQRADEMEIVCAKGGFGLKGFTFSGNDPPDKLSQDGKSICVGGILWFSKNDFISIDIADLNFSKKVRGKKPATTSDIPEKLTRRQCVSKVSEVFDITGKLTPITAAMKLDLHDLVLRQLNWDDVIPDTLRPIWKSHFELLQEIKNVKYARCVIPEDAVNSEISTLDFGDASKKMTAVAIYARVLRKNGEYSSQLIFARSKIIPNAISQPRAELMAAVLNAHTGEVVKNALQSKHVGWTKLTDSQIILHWISNDEITLKQFVRNRIIEIKRFTNPEEWFYINTKHMMADIATRRGSTLADINNDSVWINGDRWMKQETLPTKTVSDIILNITEMHEVNNEASSPSMTPNEVSTCNFASTKSNTYLSDEMKKRYLFSSYLIDPNKFCFEKVVRIIAIVIKYVNLLKYLVNVKNSSISSVSKEDVINRPTQHPAIFLSDDEITLAEQYFWRKGSSEVRHFVKEGRYKHISKCIDGVLTFTGRILSTKIQITTPMTNAMKDLSSTTFCVPILEKHSPISYSIVNEVHWEKAVKHSGIENTWRYVLRKVYIIEGRELVKRLKKECTKCHIMEKKKVEVEMGKLPTSSLTIAPAFYNCQVDLAGPFSSYTNHNKRKTVKIWLVVFICTTTSTTTIKVMDDYSGQAFFQAFVRFACESGYPKTLFVDRGSQILSTCNEARINFQDLKFKLHNDVKVDFHLCPVGGHNYNGKVERRIREIKTSLERSYTGQRLSVLQWETVSAEIANAINDLPLALGNHTSDFESMDLITPNRLKLGRNNERSPVGPYEIPTSSSRILKSNTEIFNAWFENWLVSHVPNLVHQPKWFKSEYDITINDVVLFLKNDSPICNTYQYGLVVKLFASNDGKTRKVTVKYKNSTENVFRETVRAVRELVVIMKNEEEN